jgi:hypothetical protein
VLRHEDVWGSACVDPCLVSSGLVEGEWSALRPCHFTPGIHWIWGWSALETVRTIWRNDNSWPYRDSNPSPLVVQPVVSRYTYCAIAAHSENNKTFANVIPLPANKCMATENDRDGSDQKHSLFFRTVLQTSVSQTFCCRGFPKWKFVYILHIIKMK